jgi:hypothetical protein
MSGHIDDRDRPPSRPSPTNLMSIFASADGGFDGVIGLDPKLANMAC